MSYIQCQLSMVNLSCRPGNIRNYRRNPPTMPVQCDRSCSILSSWSFADLPNALSYLEFVATYAKETDAVAQLQREHVARPERFATWRPQCAGELFFPSLAASSPPKSSRHVPLQCSEYLRVLRVLFFSARRVRYVT